MVERAIGNCAIDAGIHRLLARTTWPLDQTDVFLVRQRFVRVYVHGFNTVSREKKKKKKRICSQRPYRYTERGGGT